MHRGSPDDFNNMFSVFRKCQGKFDCLIFDMLLISDLKFSLNTQSDLIKAKLFK